MTFAELDLVLQAHRNLENLRADIRANAALYQAQLAAGRPAKEVAEMMAGDAAQYERRLKWHADFVADPSRKAAMDSALRALTLDPAEHEAILGELTNATAIQAVGKDVATVAETLLVTVATHEKLFGFGEVAAVDVKPLGVKPGPPK